MSRRGTRILVAGLALALFAAPGADAKKKKRKKPPGPVVVVTKTIAVAPQSEGIATATCPKGTGITGGGFVSSPLAQSGSSFVADNHRFGNGWLVRAINASGAASTGSLTVEAYCRKRAPALTESTAVISLPPGGLGIFPNGAASATCPAGKAAAGGFTSTAASVGGGYNGPYVFSSSRDGAAAWRVAAGNTVNQPRTVTVHVYCSVKSLREVFSPTVPTGAPNTQVSADTPICPKVKTKKKKKKPGTPVAGGFFQQSLTVTLNPATSGGAFISESRRVGNVWHSQGVSVGNVPGSLRSSANCG